MRIIENKGIFEIVIELNMGYDAIGSKDSVAMRYQQVVDLYQLNKNEEIFNPWILEIHPTLHDHLVLKLRHNSYLMFGDGFHIIDHTMMDLVPSLLIYISLLMLELDAIISDNQILYIDGDDDHIHMGVLTINPFEDGQGNRGVSITLIRTFNSDSKTEKLLLTNKDLDSRDFMVRDKKGIRHYDEYPWDLVSTLEPK